MFFQSLSWVKKPQTFQNGRTLSEYYRQTVLQLLYQLCSVSYYWYRCECWSSWYCWYPRRKEVANSWTLSHLTITFIEDTIFWVFTGWIKTQICDSCRSCMWAVLAPVLQNLNLRQHMFTNAYYHWRVSPAKGFAPLCQIFPCQSQVYFLVSNFKFPVAGSPLDSFQGCQARKHHVRDIMVQASDVNTTFCIIQYRLQMWTPPSA